MIAAFFFGFLTGCIFMITVYYLWCRLTDTSGPDKPHPQ
jgi:hypothetical protein